MNSRLANIPILLSLCLLLAAYHFRAHNRNTAADQLQPKLQALQNMLPPAATVYFNSKATYLETYMHIRYLLAPRTLHYTRDTTADTMMYLLPVTEPVSKTHIAWQYTDDQFHYLLTIKPH